MEEVISPYWNILAPQVVEKGTQSYQYNEYQVDGISDIKDKSQYEIHINNGRWVLLSKAFLHVKSKIKKEGNNKIVTVSNNGVNDFRTAKLYYEEQEIERIDNLGIVSTISNLVNFSKDISNSTASQLCWYIDTADKERFKYDDTKQNIQDKIKSNPDFNNGYLERYQLTKGGKILEKFIPLSLIFRFCRDVNKALNGKIRILLDKNSDKNILHAVTDGDFEYEINYLSLWIPEVVPSLTVQLELDKILNSESTISHGFNIVTGYRSSLQTADSGVWNVINSYNKVNAVYVVFSKQHREENLKKSKMIFDHNNLQSIHTIVNNKQFPMKDYKSSFQPNEINVARLYTSFLEMGFNTMDEGTSVSYKDFCLLYPVICFDLRKQDDDNIMNRTEIKLEWNLKEKSDDYYVYAVVESERLININVVDKKIYIE